MPYRALAAAAAILLSASLASAGQTQSRTVVPTQDQAAEVCDPFVYDYALNMSVGFYLDGKVSGWYAVTVVNIADFAIWWNNVHPNNMIPGDLVYDSAIGFTIPEGSDLGPTGDYVFLYSAGCYAAQIVAPPLPPNGGATPEVHIEWKSFKQWDLFGYIERRNDKHPWRGGAMPNGDEIAVALGSM